MGVSRLLDAFLQPRESGKKMTDVTPSTPSLKPPDPVVLSASWARNFTAGTIGVPNLSRTTDDTFREKRNCMEATEIKTILVAQSTARFFDYAQLAALLYESPQMLRDDDFNRHFQGSHGYLGGTAVPLQGIFCVFWQINKDKIDHKYCQGPARVALTSLPHASVSQARRLHATSTA